MEKDVVQRYTYNCINNINGCFSFFFKHFHLSYENSHSIQKIFLYLCLSENFLLPWRYSVVFNWEFMLKSQRELGKTRHPVIHLNPIESICRKELVLENTAPSAAPKRRGWLILISQILQGQNCGHYSWSPLSLLTIISLCFYKNSCTDSASSPLLSTDVFILSSNS